MPRFRFNLDKLLDYRGQLQKQAEKAFAEAMNEVKQAEDHLAELRVQRTAAFKERAKQLQAAELAHDFLTGQDLLIKKAIQQLEERRKFAEVEREKLLQAAQETKIVERLKEKKRQEFKLENEKKEQKKADDLTTTRLRQGERFK